jgi:TetR/AcrR family transcriptional regulator, cholesterol catabolism regulator
MAPKPASPDTSTKKSTDKAMSKSPVVQTKRPPRFENDSDIGRRRSKAIADGTDAYQERRREIARVAASIFDKKGFRGTSLGAVAAAMGTDRASLYYYISNKRELYDEVVREVTEANVATAERIRDSDSIPLDKLRTLVIELMRSYAENYPILYVYIRENLSHVEDERTAWSIYMRAMNRRYENVVVEIIQEGINDGTIRPLSSARVLAFGVLGMVGWTNRWFQPPLPGKSNNGLPGKSPTEAADDIGIAYAELAVAGLRAGRSDTTQTDTTKTDTQQRNTRQRNTRERSTRPSHAAQP